MRHHVARAHTLQRILHCHLRVTFLRGAQQKAADERSPNASHPIARKHLAHSENYHHVCKNLAGSGGNLCRALEIFRDAPCDSAQETSAIEGKPRHEIEKRQREIDLPKPLRRGSHQIVAMKESPDEIEATSQEQARKRPGDGDIEFLFWFVRL